MRNFRIYRPGKNGGCAAEFQLKTIGEKYPEFAVMMQVVPQEGFDEKENAKFTWARGDSYKGITMKLATNDLGEILSVINGVKPSAGNGKGLYHENAKGNSILKFEVSEKGIQLNISNKVGDGTPTKFYMILGSSDVEVLRILFTEAIKKNYGW